MARFAAALAAFRLRAPAQVRAEADARAARLIGPLDALQHDFATTLGRMHADIPSLDRRKAPRKES